MTIEKEYYLNCDKCCKLYASRSDDYQDIEDESAVRYFKSFVERTGHRVTK